MNLREWMRDNGRKSREIEELTGKSQQLVSDWLRGSRVPGPLDIARIAEFTGGIVGLTDWIAADTPNRSKRSATAAGGQR